MYPNEKGFLKPEISRKSTDTGQGSVKQVLTPAFITVANHAH
jgi:hypothetical protein